MLGPLDGSTRAVLRLVAGRLFDESLSPDFRPNDTVDLNPDSPVFIAGAPASSEQRARLADLGIRVGLAGCDPGPDVLVLSARDVEEVAAVLPGVGLLVRDDEPLSVALGALWDWTADWMAPF